MFNPKRGNAAAGRPSSSFCDEYNEKQWEVDSFVVLQQRTEFNKVLTIFQSSFIANTG